MACARLASSPSSSLMARPPPRRRLVPPARRPASRRGRLRRTGPWPARAVRPAADGRSRTAAAQRRPSDRWPARCQKRHRAPTIRSPMSASSCSIDQRSAARRFSCSVCRVTIDCRSSGPRRPGSASSATRRNHCACRRSAPARSSSTSSRSSANSRIVCSMPKRTSPSPAGNREDEAGVREHGQAGQDVDAAASSPAQTAAAACRVNPPVSTETRRNRLRSLVGEQVVAPADRGAQGLLAGREVACAGVEQRLAAVQPLQHRRRTQDGGA